MPDEHQLEPSIVVIPPVLLPMDAQRERRAVELLAELLADLLDEPSSPSGGDRHAHD
jgi:hypothetical protein